MTLTWKQIADIALNALADEGKLSGSAVYLEPVILEALQTYRLGRNDVQLASASVMVFADLVPAANWSHPSSYLLVDVETGETQQFEGQFPPPREGLKLIYRGEGVEDWMLLSQDTLESSDH